MTDDADLGDESTTHSDNDVEVNAKSKPATKKTSGNSKSTPTRIIAKNVLTKTEARLDAALVTSLPHLAEFDMNSYQIQESRSFLSLTPLIIILDIHVIFFQ